MAEDETDAEKTQETSEEGQEALDKKAKDLEVVQ